MIVLEAKTPNGDDCTIGFSSLESKVFDIKELLAETTNHPANEFRLTYKGKTLEDDQTLESYGIEEYDTIVMEPPLSDDHIDPDPNPNPDTTTGDLASPGLDPRLTGYSMPDMSEISLYDSMSQVMRILLSSPQSVKQIIDQTPQLHDSIPQLSEMLQNPEAAGVVHLLTSRPVIQQMMSTPLLPENNQYLSGILPPGATPVPLEQLFEAQLKHLQETRNP